MADPNIQLLKDAAKLLRPLLNELVFVGGSTTGLFITDPGAGDVRPTVDVDAITEITSYLEYVSFSDKLRRLGFVEDTSEDSPTCRWLNGGVTLDVMPLNEEILGFSNRWYHAGIGSAQEHNLEPGLRIKVVTAPYFCATKIEAFKGRGNNDYLGSSDLEDLVTVVDGRPELLDELRSAPDDVRSYIAEAIGQMLETDRFNDALPGYLPGDASSQSRIKLVQKALNEISKLR